MRKLDAHEQGEVESYLNMLHHHGVFIIASYCAGCGLYLGVKDGRGNHGISHGICDACKAIVLENARHERGK